MKRDPRSSDRLAGPLYLLAAFLVIVPLADFLTNVWPMRPGEFAWRYGSVGLFTGFVPTPLLGMALFIYLTNAWQSRLPARLFSWSAVVGALFMLILVPLFMLDGIQMRATVPADSAAPFDIGLGKAVFKLLFAAVVLGWLGVAGLRGIRPAPTAPQVVATSRE